MADLLVGRVVSGDSRGLRSHRRQRNILQRIFGDGPFTSQAASGTGSGGPQPPPSTGSNIVVMGPADGRYPSGVIRC
jgi:hypothetical protein